MSLETARENYELDEEPIPDSHSLNSDENHVKADSGSAKSFNVRGLSLEKIVTDQKLREGTRVSVILFEENDEWHSHNIKPIQVGTPNIEPSVKEGNSIDPKTIGGENVDRIVKFEATLVPEDIADPESQLVFTEIKLGLVINYSLFN